MGRRQRAGHLLGQADRGRGTLVGRGQCAGGWPRGLSGGCCGQSAHACVRAEALKPGESQFTGGQRGMRRMCHSDLTGQQGYRPMEPTAARCPGAWKVPWHRVAVGARAIGGRRRQHPSLSSHKPPSGPSSCLPHAACKLVLPTEQMPKPSHPADTPMPSITWDTKNSSRKPPKTHNCPPHRHNSAF